MKDFKDYLDKIGEVGFVEQGRQALVDVKGLPRAKPSEVVIFETGEVGQVMTLSEDYAEVLLLSSSKMKTGIKVARTNKTLSLEVFPGLLGKTINSLGKILNGRVASREGAQLRQLDITPPGIDVREVVDKPLETGVSLVDLVVPLGRGQRELVVGNRKTGKTLFLHQVVYSAASKGIICVYAAIAKKRLDIKITENFFKEKGIDKNTVVIASGSADPSGLIYLAPYTAMTIGEYFRDQGKDVLVILDDLTAHAKCYRELALLARHFPGRSAYPGDIFYLHSRLLERAGNFIVSDAKSKEKIKASITCLPVAELVMGDLSGYIQTNLMSMTDGHIFFDMDLYNQGRRPPINPFLSVTRVGRQTQTPLLRDVDRTLTSFLVRLEELKKFMHFGAELSEETRRTLAQGKRVTAFFDQSSDTIIPLNINIVLLTLLWAGFWSKYDVQEMKKEFGQIIDHYRKDNPYKIKVDSFITNKNRFSELVEFVKRDDSIALGLGRKQAE